MSAPNQSIVSTELGFRLESSEQTAQTAAAAETAGGALPNVPMRYHLKKSDDDQTAQLYAKALAPLNEEPFTMGQSQLSAAQLAAIPHIIAGNSDSFVAAKIGVHVKTVTRWRLYHAAFRAELARHQYEVWSAANEKLRGSLDAALDILIDALTSTDKAAAFRAARILLMQARHFPPPNTPTDPFEVLAVHARKLKRAQESIDPMIETVDEQDLEMAARDWSLKLNREEPKPEQKEAA